MSLSNGCISKLVSCQKLQGWSVLGSGSSRNPGRNRKWWDDWQLRHCAGCCCFPTSQQGESGSGCEVDTSWSARSHTRERTCCFSPNSGLEVIYDCEFRSSAQE